MQLARQELRDSVHSLESALLALPDEITVDDKQSEEKYVTHFFAPGVYARQMLLPKGMVFVGKIHKTKHVSIISCGHVSVVTDQGKEDIKGPYTFINEPGEKRAVYAHEDTIWTTIHPTDETDIRKIEALVIAKDYAELEDMT